MLYKMTYKTDDVRQTPQETAIERMTAKNWQNFIGRTIQEKNKIWQAD